MEAVTINQLNTSRAKIIFDDTSGDIIFSKLFESISNYRFIEFDLNQIKDIASFVSPFLGWLQNINMQYVLTPLNQEIKEELEFYGFLQMYEGIRSIHSPMPRDLLIDVDQIGHNKLKCFLRNSVFC